MPLCILQFTCHRCSIAFCVFLKTLHPVWTNSSSSSLEVSLWLFLKRKSSYCDVQPPYPSVPESSLWLVKTSGEAYALNIKVRNIPIKEWWQTTNFVSIMVLEDQQKMAGALWALSELKDVLPVVLRVLVCKFSLGRGYWYPYSSNNQHYLRVFQNQNVRLHIYFKRWVLACLIDIF